MKRNQIKNRTPSSRRSAFSLLELLIVLVILTATALIVIPSFNNLQVVTPRGIAESPVEIATQATMNTVRDALIGEDGVVESLAHKTNALPREMHDLVQEEAPIHIEKEAPELTDFDPVKKLGWNGPYILATGTNDLGEPTVVDGWGNELEIQIDFDEDGQVDKAEAKYFRVVSAGPNGEIDTPADMDNMKPGTDEFSQLTRAECGDDLVMFLRVPDNRK